MLVTYSSKHLSLYKSLFLSFKPIFDKEKLNADHHFNYLQLCIFCSVLSVYKNKPYIAAAIFDNRANTKQAFAIILRSFFVGCNIYFLYTILKYFVFLFKEVFLNVQNLMRKQFCEIPVARLHKHTSLRANSDVDKLDLYL